ncbi:RNA-binding region RNP-1 domain-containing protein [Heterostelium album PN500]|uniref:RNA-binding region RNP-1 domain-containing protein n=1 Tax=Heterostelium pallidum (strain ATCC 26659 / Pp 5 / PN500) TaxID=670386 RepID=D3B807_HETP5|nr:RNA-binding region RNP-1 domain-containing protein [Heterostelium album PN500]EFA82175.1 RNA-binding region RNP-1 domain-containing protein [Heterostelium album PN500]|eukprot:XP_020434292.1 RNA-binding region RNP-1 domain-containing protein [Heterostelium album PN500]
MSADTTTAAPVNTAPVASPSKLFVGNLSFSLKETDLTEKFSVYGSVVSSRIITKRGSSLGYGFVEMDSEAAAQKAIDALNKIEIDGRAINVELTKERSTEPRQVRTTTKSTRKPRGTRKPKTNGSTAATESTSPATSPAATTPVTADKPKKRRANNARDSTATGTTATSERKPRAERGERKPAAPKQPSDNTLYVTNIPFSVGNDQLLEIFKEYAPKAAHIVFNTRFNKSKGFGFVEFNNSADQQKALALNKEGSRRSTQL